MPPEPVRQSPLIALLIARAISETGTLLSAVALPLFVWSVTGSTALVGAITALLTLPLFIVGLAGGPLVDRLGARRSSITADCGALIAFGCIPLLFARNALPLALLALLVFVGSCAEALGLTARASLLPDLARAAGWSLERATAAVSAIGRAALVLGPLLAGVLMSVMGAATVLLLDALTFGLSALLIGIGVAQNAHLRQHRTYGQALRDGLHFLRHDRQILTLMGLFGTFNLLINPVFLVILPVYTSTVLGEPSALGVVIASFGAGTLSGALLYGAVGAHVARRTVLIGSFCTIALAFVPLLVSGPLLVLAAGCALMGVGVGPCGPLIMTALAERTPVDLRGRIFGLYSAGAYGGIPIGVVIVGQMLQYTTVHITLLLVAGSFVLLTGVVFVLPQALLPATSGSSMTAQPKDLPHASQRRASPPMILSSPFIIPRNVPTRGSRSNNPDVRRITTPIAEPRRAFVCVGRFVQRRSWWSYTTAEHGRRPTAESPA